MGRKHPEIATSEPSSPPEHHGDVSVTIEDTAPPGDQSEEKAALMTKDQPQSSQEVSPLTRYSHHVDRR